LHRQVADFSTAPDRQGVALSVIRGDRKDANGESTNLLRRWSREDIIAGEADIFGERLYCIQWMNATPADALTQTQDEDEDDEQDGPSTFFAAPTKYDLANEARVVAIVKEQLSSWQRDLVPDMRIESGEETDRLMRERGWTHWHHLFTPRHLLFGAIALEAIDEVMDRTAKAALLVGFCRTPNYMSRLTQWMVRTPTLKKPADVVNHVFYNQALNTFYNFGCRASIGLLPSLNKAYPSIPIHGRAMVATCEANSVRNESDIYITDPPYADANSYHEITEYFIAWMQVLGKQMFRDFVWDSQRSLAIKGVDEKFRSDMAAAYGAMAKHMPDNGIQVVMFTHQDAGVWADLAAIMWAAGLRVTAGDSRLVPPPYRVESE
jgi:hypothetical protein